MSSSVATDDRRNALTIVARGADDSTLAIESWWGEDRFAHRLVWTFGGRRHVLLTSIEGRPDEDWPPSPPLQQMARQASSAGPILLGLGMAGANHWSASMQARSGDPNDCGLQIELACLVRQPNPRLGCRYRTGPNAWGHVDARANGWIWRPGEALPRTALRPAIQGLQETVIDCDADQLVIRPALPALPSRTIEWGFRVILLADI